MMRLKVATMFFAGISMVALLSFFGPAEVAHASCGSPSTLTLVTQQQINENKAAYQAVSAQTQVPWELLAAIHYRETSFGKSNPSNGQGIFQFVNGEGGPYPTGPVSDTEFRRQLKFMAEEIQDDYVWRSDLNYQQRRLRATNEDDFRIKDLLFSYNGRAAVYKQQATALGFNASIEPYEGSPYVMNRIDCARLSMGIITLDFGGLDGNDTRYGAFTMYNELTGGGNGTYPDSIVDGSDFSAGKLIDDATFFNTNAMTPAQIQAFLVQRTPNCDTQGVQPSEYGSGTRANYGTGFSSPPPYTCLFQYRENTTTHANNLNGAAIPPANTNAAHIIWDAAQDNGINPQVLLALIEAEHGLVSDDWPWPSQYEIAGRVECSEVAAICAAEYDGFYNQMNKLAELLVEYADPLAGNTYVAGQTYTVNYSANSSCGGDSVFMFSNGAAALYNLMEYQPNASALSNTYSSGNSCSSYEVRDFWTFFNNSFGNSFTGPLVKSTASSTVYLVADNTKYSIDGIGTLQSLFPLGDVSVVPQSYLDTITDGGSMPRLIRGSTSSLYFFEAGIKLPFTSCAQVADYGLTCGGYVQLGQGYVDDFSTGPAMTRNVRTKTTNKFFTVSNGTKREAVDADTLRDAGFTNAFHVFNNSALASLPYGQPVIDEGAIAQSRTTQKHYIIEGGKAHFVPTALVAETTVAEDSQGQLDSGSLLAVGTQTFSGLFSDVDGAYALVGDEKMPLANSASWSSSITDLPEFSENLPMSDTTLDELSFVKSSKSASVFLVQDSKKHPIVGWTDLLIFSDQESPEITRIPEHYLGELSTGATLWAPTRLVKSPDSATIYFVDGLLQKRAFSSFSTIRAMGLSTSIRTMSSANLDDYELASNLNHRVSCNGVEYMAFNGELHAVDASAKAAFGLSDFVPLDELTCANLVIGDPLTQRYVRATTGNSIFYVENGQKRQFMSYNAYINHGGSNSLRMDSFIVNSLPSGAPIN